MAAVFTYLSTTCFPLRAIDRSSNVQNRNCSYFPYNRNCPVISAPLLCNWKMFSWYEAHFQKGSMLRLWDIRQSLHINQVHKNNVLLQFQLLTKPYFLINVKKLCYQPIKLIWIHLNHIMRKPPLCICNAVRSKALISWAITSQLISWPLISLHR